MVRVLLKNHLTSLVNLIQLIKSLKEVIEMHFKNLNQHAAHLCGQKLPSQNTAIIIIIT